MNSGSWSGRKETEGEESEDDDYSDEGLVPADPNTEGESALDKVSGEWEGTEENEDEIHDPFEEGGTDDGDGEEAPAENGDAQ